MINVEGIHEGECSKVMSGWPADCIDMVLTSPPYADLLNYRGFKFDLAAIARQLFRVLKDGGVMVWVIGDKTVDYSRQMIPYTHAFGLRDAGFCIYDVMIYSKPAGRYMNRYRYPNVYEHMIVASKGKPKTFNPIMVKTKKPGDSRNTTILHRDADNNRTLGYRTTAEERPHDNIWKYSPGFGAVDRYAFEHPAVFPEKLARDQIISWSNPNDIVLDPMCGSGTTLKMARVYGRRYAGIDVAPEYLEIVRRRLRECSPNMERYLW